VILPEPQRRELLRSHGMYVSEICDHCGRVLGAVRFTRYGKPGAWCSRLCRDGVDPHSGVCRNCGVALTGKRKGALFCSDVCRMRQRVQDRLNNAKRRIQNKSLKSTVLEPT
jgi:hypothetical protein